MFACDLVAVAVRQDMGLCRGQQSNWCRGEGTPHFRPITVAVLNNCCWIDRTPFHALAVDGCGSPTPQAGLWASPSPPVRPLSTPPHTSDTRADAGDRRFADAVDNSGTLHLLARVGGVAIPALHTWRDGWLRSTVVVLNLPRMFPDHCM